MSKKILIILGLIVSLSLIAGETSPGVGYSNGSGGGGSSLTTITGTPGPLIPIVGASVGLQGVTALNTTIGGRTTGVAIAPATISNSVLTTNVATITTNPAHNFKVGMNVTVTAVTNTGLNGTFHIATVPTVTTFTYAFTHADIGTSVDTGTVTNNPEYQLAAQATTASATSDITLGSSGATQVPLLVQGAPAQTGDWQQWQSSAGAVFGALTSDGSGLILWNKNNNYLINAVGTDQTGTMTIAGFFYPYRYPSGGAGSVSTDLGRVGSNTWQHVHIFGIYKFGATNGGADDTGLARNASGVVEVNTATAGTFGQLITAAGGGTGSLKTSGLLNSQVNSLGNPVTVTTETDAHTYPVPATTFNNNGQVIRYHAYGTFASTTSAQTVRVYFGGTVVGTIVATISLSGQWDANLIVSRTGSNTQWASFTSTTDATASTSTTVTTGTTLAKTDTSGIIMKTTVQEGTLGVANDITEKGFHIWFDNY